MIRTSDPPTRTRRRRAAGVFEALVQTRGCAERFGDVPESSMLPAEATAVATASDARRREFATVRHCARLALRRIGMPAVPVLTDSDGVPQWPDRVVGSLTHCPGYRAAVVGPDSMWRGVGIDAEPHAALPSAAAEFVLRAEERTRLRDLSDTDSDLHWDRVLFSAKEAVFKAWFPLTRVWLEFEDVSLTVQPDGTFEARLRIDDPMTDVFHDGLTGRWTVDRGLVVTANWVTA